MIDNNYQKLTVRLTPEYEDIWIAHCFEQGASGLETTEEKALSIIMAVYFTDMSIQMQDVFELFYQKFMIDKQSLRLLNMETHANKNWLETWKIHFHPISINDQLLICPPWDIPRNEKQIVIINPGNGFGSGSHPSTVIALKLLVAFLEKESSKNLSILDVGTGSGILLVASRKMGAGKLVGIDIDLPSIIDAQNNFKLNRLDQVITICGSPACIQSSFDIVISNMMLHEIQSIQKDILRNMSPSGALILSGFYLSQKKQVLDCFNELQVVLEMDDAQWWGVILK
jgi:ribosomal protein L11 methyltransferase